MAREGEKWFSIVFFFVQRKILSIGILSVGISSKQIKFKRLVMFLF